MMTAMTDVPDHPLRYSLTNELHARPFATLTAPAQVTHLAMLSPVGEKDSEISHLLSLCRRYGAAEPAEGATHFMVEIGSFRLKWERHSEFTTYSFFHAGTPEPFADGPATLPEDWIAGLPGERIVALNLVFLPSAEGGVSNEELARFFVPDSLCHGAMIGGRAAVWTDFRIHGNGYSRILLQDGGLSPREAGRLVQQLAELETYRTMALLALPQAREVSPWWAGWTGISQRSPAA